MQRHAALRASSFFLLASLVFAAIGIATFSPLAEAVTLIAGALCAVTLLFGIATPKPVPIRVRRDRRP